MSAVDKVLAGRVEKLTHENAALQLQNERLARLLANALDILQSHERRTREELRHFSLCRNHREKFDWKKLLNR